MADIYSKLYVSGYAFELWYYGKCEFFCKTPTDYLTASNQCSVIMDFMVLRLMEDFLLWWTNAFLHIFLKTVWTIVDYKKI